jgi:hypothetical protein
MRVGMDMGSVHASPSELPYVFEDKLGRVILPLLSGVEGGRRSRLLSRLRFLVRRIEDSPRMFE